MALRRPLSQRTLFSFKSPKEVDKWKVITDECVGGSSRASLSATSDHSVVFEGEVSRKFARAVKPNVANLGFCAIVSKPSASKFDIDKHTHIAFRAKPDEHLYRFKLRPSKFTGNPDVTYDGDFTAESPPKWHNFMLPLASLTRSINGKPYLTELQWDSPQIYQVIFMVQDHEGPFRLELESLSLLQYGQPGESSSVFLPPRARAPSFVNSALWQLFRWNRSDTAQRTTMQREPLTEQEQQQMRELQELEKKRQEEEEKQEEREAVDYFDRPRDWRL